jgi:hypothetical protein
MRMQFVVDKDNFLRVVSAPRTGFNYGHSGDGRGAAAFLHIGDKEWKDYRVEMYIWGGGAGEFNPHKVDDCANGSFQIYFRTEDYKENWNQPSRTSYMVTLNTAPQRCEGKAWPESSLYRVNNWSAANQKEIKELAKIDGRLWKADVANHVIIEVQGRNISIMINGGHALGYYDDDPQALFYGGMGVQWNWENLGWIDNVIVTKL